MESALDVPVSNTEWADAKSVYIQGGAVKLTIFVEGEPVLIGFSFDQQGVAQFKDPTQVRKLRLGHHSMTFPQRLYGFRLRVDSGTAVVDYDAQ